LGNNTFVAVGNAATVFTAEHNYTSPGGVTVPATGTVNGWSAATTLPGGYSADLSAVIYDGARFVALGRTDGSIITSTDADTWTAGTSIGIADMNALAYGAGTTYIAVGNGGVIYKNTTAGVTGAWTVKTSGTTNNLYGVSYVNGIFVAVGAGGVLLTSTDGDTWTLQTSNTSNDLHDIAFGASTYVAVGDAGTIVSSTDTATWALQTNPTVPASQNLRTICFGPDAQFIAAGTTGTIVYSTTGLATSWSASNAGSSALNSIAPSDVFIAVGDDGAYVSAK